MLRTFPRTLHGFAPHLKFTPVLAMTLILFCTLNTNSIGQFKHIPQLQNPHVYQKQVNFTLYQAMKDQRGVEI